MSGTKAANVDGLIQGKCLVAANVDRLKLQIESLPFDLVVSTPTSVPMVVSTFVSQLSAKGVRTSLKEGGSVFVLLASLEDSRLSERVSPGREGLAWARGGSLGKWKLGYTEGFSPERDLARLGEGEGC
ncbi:hypothetical protein Lal_00014349 [Lupinus albus]|nr:hypothetical protein Lal_00014349 [Lupinus albus]